VPKRRQGSGRPRDPNLEQRAFEAARVIYGESGATQVTFANVASRAGIGKPALYRRWESPQDLLLEDGDGNLVAVACLAGCRAGAEDVKTLRGRESSVDLTHRIEELGVRTTAARELAVDQREIATLEVSIHERLMLDIAQLGDDVSHLLRKRRMPDEPKAEIDVRSSAVRFSESHDIGVIERCQQGVERLIPPGILGRQKNGWPGILERHACARVQGDR